MKKLLLGLMIFLLIFAFVSVGITSCLIFIANLPAPVEVQKGIDLNGTYDQNDLEVLEITEDYNGCEITLPKIDGLKNLKVQDKINNDMYRRIYNLLEGYDSLDYASFYTQANFSNVISISFNAGGDDKYENIYFNYSLTDGSPIKFEDLFVSEDYVLDVVRRSFYEELSMYGDYDEESDTFLVSEEKVYQTVKSFMENPDKEFLFSPREIYLYQGDNFASVDMVSIADKIAIYSRYLTKNSIFTGKYKGYKDIFTCADIPAELIDRLYYGMAGENLWYDITAMRYHDWSEENPDDRKTERFKEFKQEMYHKAYSALDEYEQKAKDNPDKFYIVLIKPDISQYEDSEYIDGEWHSDLSDMALVSNSVQVFEMPFDLYETVYKDKILEGYRNRFYSMLGGLLIEVEDDDTQGAVITQSETSEVYDFMTGEKITELEDLFYPDSGYMEIIENEINEGLESAGYYGYTIDDAVIEIKRATITATFPELDDFCVYIYFDSFDKSMMKHFD